MQQEQSRQCQLRRKSGNAEFYQIAWIPSPKAILGKILRLKNDLTGCWEEGWEVVDRGLFAVPTSYVVEWSRVFTQTRKASDI